MNKRYIKKKYDKVGHFDVMCPICHKNIRIRSKLEAHHKQIYFRVDQDGLRVDDRNLTRVFTAPSKPPTAFSGHRRLFFPCKTMFKVQKLTVL